MDMSRNFRDVPKRSEPLKVKCCLETCIYFEGYLEKELGRALCSHPDKAQYLTTDRCPLYRMDWLRHVRLLNAKPKPPSQK